MTKKAATKLTLEDIEAERVAAAEFRVGQKVEMKSSE